jgi:hypothetical protein
MHKIARPDMMAMCWAQSHTRTLSQPNATALFIYRNLQPLTPPQAFNALVIDLSAWFAQQCRNSPIAVTTILPCQINGVGNQLGFNREPLGHAALCRSMLVNDATNPAFRYRHSAMYLSDKCAA